jgi:uncharacterized membrane protein
MKMGQIVARLQHRMLPLKFLVGISVGLLLVGWLLNTPEGLLGKADAIGYAVCHRIDSHSLHLGDRPMPLCARCSGMYLGAMLGLVYQAVFSRRKGGTPPKKILLALAVCFVAFGIDGLNSYLSLFPGAPSAYTPQNWLRVLTGTGMGLVIITVLYPIFNQTVWKEWDRRPAIGGWRQFLGLAALALILDLVVLTENPIVLYPLALISAAGVLVLLTMIYSMVALMVFKAENHFQTVAGLFLPLTSGFGLALLQIVVLDFVRYFFTGTWDGFHLG